MSVDHSFDLILRGGEVLLGSHMTRCDVAVRDGRIARLLEPGEGTATSVFDASGLTILPGVIDIHCHVRAPAFPERGTVESETAAAAAGGVTTLFEMPITDPCCNSAARVAGRRAHFAEHALVDFGMYAAPGSIEPDAVDAMVEAGAIAFKFFTTKAPMGRMPEFAGLAFGDEADHLRILTALARTGLPVVVHAESASLLDHYEAEVAALDPTLARTLNASRPPVVEALSVAKLLTLNMVAGAKLHIAHVTAAMTVEVLRRFAGTSDFTAETCPHYLFRTVEDVQRAGVAAKITPPVRGANDQAAIWQAIADGVINHVTTDHAAFSVAEKAAARGNFLRAPAGSPGLEVLVPAMLEAVAAGRIDLPRLGALLSANAASRFGLDGRKGRIAPGADADLTIVDRAGWTRITPETLLTKARDVADLYAGAEFRGCVRATVVGGRVVYQDGRIVGRPGDGRPVAPDHAGAGAGDRPVGTTVMRSA